MYELTWWASEFIVCIMIPITGSENHHESATRCRTEDTDECINRRYCAVELRHTDKTHATVGWGRWMVA